MRGKLEGVASGQLVMTVFLSHNIPQGKPGRYLIGNIVVDCKRRDFALEALPVSFSLNTSLCPNVTLDFPIPSPRNAEEVNFY